MRTRVVLSALLTASCGHVHASETPAGPAPPTDVSNIILQNDAGLIVEWSTDKKVAALKTRFSKDEDSYLWLLNVSGPFDEAQSQAPVGDLDGLSTSANAEVGYQIVNGDRRERTTIAAKAGHRSFKYVDPIDLAKDASEEHTGYDVSVTWSKFFAGPALLRGGALFGARARFQESYQPQAEVQLCVPYATGSDATRCRTTGMGVPKKVRSPILQAQLAVAPWEAVGLSVLISRDFELNATGIEVPAYLIRDNETGLFNGGIKLSWRSDEDDLQAILFIGVPLGTF